MLTSLSTIVTDLQGGSIMSLGTWILLGALIGFIGSKIVNKTGHGLVRDVLLGIFGAIVAGFLANLLGEGRTAGVDRYSLFVAAVGAVVFFITYHGMFRRGRTPWEVTLIERLKRRRKGRVEHQSQSHSQASVISETKPVLVKAIEK
jgi:uncharacterized membrane protein YeaQ/YmgE (transglycosylase-associated protein family)